MIPVIDTALTAISDVSKLITATIPSDELQRERFKERRPLLYAHIRMRLMNKCRRELRKRWHQDIDATVDLYMGALASDEREYAKKLLHKQFAR